MIIVPSPGWEELLKRLASLEGSAFFLGRSDSGKTTLIRYLLTRLCLAGRPVALVDADVGQSSLGLPGAVSRRSFRSAPEEGPLRWEHLSFLGSVTPVPILSLLAAETGRMVLDSRREVPLTLVDSTGLVDGPLGLALKLAKIRAVAPELVVAVTGGSELDPILRALPDAVEIVRLTPSDHVLRRSPVQRIRRRQARLAEHLEGARETMIATRRLIFLHRGAPLHPVFAPPEAGTVIGLNHLADTRALAVVTEADADSLTVTTALSSLHGIDRVILGDFCYDPMASLSGDDDPLPEAERVASGGQ
jgi:polynucleotide 5'-hydroxyl-kinase GRC3/NOL9